MAKGVAEEYSSSLADLTVNSKPLINMLTMLAEDYIEHAPTIVRTVEAHLQKVPGDIKLPVLYLIDSIVKNVGKDYTNLFTQNIVSTFCTVFEQVDEKTRSQMFKLRQTWNEVFPSKKLYALDARVNSIDPAWPITAPPPRIHVNPKFLNTVPPQNEPNPVASITSLTDSSMREELLKKQKELLELQKRKVELELLQTKVILEEQQKKLENQTASRLGENTNTANSSKVSKPTIPHPEIVDTSESKKVTVVEKPEKTKFASTKRRDPRLNSRKLSDQGFTSWKENPKTESTIKLPSPKDKHKEGGEQVLVPESRKNNETTGSNNSTRHYKKRNEKNKKQKDNKPRSKKWSGVLPHGKEIKTKSTVKQINTDLSTSKNNIDKQNVSATEAILAISKPDVSRPENLMECGDDQKYLQGEKLDLHETMDHLKPEIPLSQPVSELNENRLDSATEQIPMEIDQNPIDKDEDNVSVVETSHVMPRSSDTSPMIPLKENESSIFLPDSQTQLNTCCDTDLRLLPPQPNSDLEQPPEKKPKSDVQKLFGGEDVDYRQSLVPIPPPPPIISKSDMKNSEGWANFKRSNSDRGCSGRSPKKRKPTVTSPRSLFRKKDDEGMDDESEDRNNSLMLIMKEAEEQLKNETITYAQYNQMLKGVMSLNEENKLQEALMKDDYESIDSPESDSNVSTDAQLHSDTGLSESEGNRPGLSADGDENISLHPKTFKDTCENTTNDHDDRRKQHSKNHEHYDRFKAPRHGRFYNRDDDSFPIDSNKPWMARQQLSAFPHRSKKEFGGRWHFNQNRQKPSEYPIVGSVNLRMRGPRHHPEISIPPADPSVLDLIDSDPMTYVNVGNSPKEVRFYGENAIILMDWDDPRDLMFQPGSRRVFIDGVDVLTLQFNAPYREYTLNYGLRIRIRLGAPTRELFIDGRFYEVKFGGTAVEINLGGRTHLIRLEGPLPFLNIGTVKRTDLVAGKVNLIVDGKIENLFPIYLDAKPQKFEINGIPFIIRFVESLQTVVINGQALKIPFGGIPVPIFFRGERHFLRLTTLPPNIIPGFVKILNMEGGRLSTPPPPRIAPPPPVINETPPFALPVFMNQPKGYDFLGSTHPSFTPNSDFAQYSVSSTSASEKPVDVLTSLMPPPVPRLALQNYQVEPYQDAPAAATSAAQPTASPLISPRIDVVELYQKLVAMGVVPKDEKRKEETENTFEIRTVDFSKPETMKSKQPGLIKLLYSGIQCSSCGVRFSPEQTVKYSQHLDWHFRQNRRERNYGRMAQSRKWNYDVSDWIQYQEIEDDEDRAQSWFEIQDKKTLGEVEEEATEPSVPAKGFGENPYCTVCRDKFDQFFNEDKEEWQLKSAVCVNEKLYHPLCYKDEQENQGKNIVPVMVPIPEDEPIETIDLEAVGDSGEEEKANIETIDIDSSSKSPQEADLAEIGDKQENTDPVHSETENTLNEVEPDVYNEEIGDDPKSVAEEIPEGDGNVANSAPESDDDILEIEVIEPHIESYDILDDDDEEELAEKQECDKSDSVSVNETSEETSAETAEVKKDIVVKTEPIDVNAVSATNTSHINETIYLDGNSEFSAPKITLPKKIKINISSVLSKNNTDDTSNGIMIISQDENSTDNLITYNYTEPLPPGEEPLFTSQLKPHLIGKRMYEMPPVNKGKEMSGLCSIM